MSVCILFPAAIDSLQESRVPHPNVCPAVPLVFLLTTCCLKTCFDGVRQRVSNICQVWESVKTLSCFTLMADKAPQVILHTDLYKTFVSQMADSCVLVSTPQLCVYLQARRRGSRGCSRRGAGRAFAPSWTRSRGSPPGKSPTTCFCPASLPSTRPGESCCKNTTSQTSVRPPLCKNFDVRSTAGHHP